jgi:hypothetical protein
MCLLRECLRLLRGGLGFTDYRIHRRVGGGFDRYQRIEYVSQSWLTGRAIGAAVTR